MTKIESNFYKKGFKKIAGIDEAGRGCWAGPLVVALCVLPKNYLNPNIKDSKKINKLKREKVFQEVIQNALYYDFIIYDAEFVDKNNPKKTSILGMKTLITRAQDNIDVALIDAEKVNANIETLSIVKGDQISQSIAAASIIAKTIRDQEMKLISKKYPEFQFENHQGYGTKQHLENLRKFGPIKGVHRFSYKPIKSVA